MSLGVCVVGLMAYHYGRHSLLELERAHAPKKAIEVATPGGAEIIRINSQLQEALRQRYETEVQLQSLSNRTQDIQNQLKQEHEQFAQALNSISKAPKMKGTDDLAAQVQAVALHFAAIQSEHNALQARQRSIDDQLTELSTQLAALKANGTTVSVPGEVSNSTAISRELVILKERNRLTLYADEAISTGKASPVRALWAAWRNPELEVIKHGAMVEILRVQNHFFDFTQLPPDFRLPIKDPAVREDHQLPVEVLVSFLADEKQPTLVRSRAARLLAKHHSSSVAEALVTAMERDADIDVIKEAQFALKEGFQMHASLFDFEFATNWLKKEKDLLSKPQSP
jgi:predicted  nucleic acid-binding Zn-ribbon protein